MSGYGYLTREEHKRIISDMRDSGFDQFHNMMAFVKYDGVSKLFYSYRTYIARYVNNRLWVNWHAFDCSPTTRKQFSRWLREANTGVTYSDIKSVASEDGCEDFTAMGGSYIFTGNGRSTEVIFEF